MSLNVLAAHGFLQALGSVEDLLGSLQHLVRGFHRSFLLHGSVSSSSWTLTSP